MGFQAPLPVPPEDREPKARQKPTVIGAHMRLIMAVEDDPVEQLYDLREAVKVIQGTLPTGAKLYLDEVVVADNGERRGYK